MTEELCRTVALACNSALTASELAARDRALRRATTALTRLRAQAAPRSRHRRLAEQCYELTQTALGPSRRFHAGSLAGEQEEGDAEERQLELLCQTEARLGRARSAVSRALEVG